MNLKAQGAQTQGILEAGTYVVGASTVALRDAVVRAISGTRLYRPGEVPRSFHPHGARLALEVTAESTLAAARRLVAENPVALNFASAKNPGGGWLSGARSQEESIARASGLVPCLEAQPAYYVANRAMRSCLYTDHLIYSPQVPVFRDDSGELLPEPFLCAFITSPAPNQGAIARNTPDELVQVVPTLARRGRQVLQVAAAHGHRTVILGAWGCGAFRCEASEVAGVFSELMREPWIEQAFVRVVFAIMGGRPGQDTLEHFRNRLSEMPPALPADALPE